MPHLHFARTVYKVGSVAASDRIEYITGQRAPQGEKGARQIRYQKEGREDLVEEGTRNLPDWAQGDPYRYFRAAEQYERKSPNDSQRRGISFEELKISLPRELTREANTVLMFDLLDGLAGDTLPITYAFHAPRTMNDSSQQPHIHLLISGRITDEYSRNAAQHFRRYNHAHPARGGARKSPMLNHHGAVKANRILVSDIINLHLERDGLAVRIHPDQLQDRGITRPPEPKLLPSESRAYRKNGVVTETMAEVLAIRAQRAEGAEQRNAQAYWAQRKEGLGITDTISLPERLVLVRAARDERVHTAPVRVSRESLTNQHATIQHARTSLEEYLMDLERESHAEQRGGDARPVPEQWRTEEVLANGVAHGLPRDAEADRIVAIARTFGYGQEASVAGGTLHVRLHERERERGLGW